MNTKNCGIHNSTGYHWKCLNVIVFGVCKDRTNQIMCYYKLKKKGPSKRTKKTRELVSINPRLTA